MANTISYYCPLCIKEEGCGYHGLLWFPGSDKPVCTHHTNDTNAPDAVPMKPVKRPTLREIKADPNLKRIPPSGLEQQAPWPSDEQAPHDAD